VPECPLSSMQAGVASALARIAHEILEDNSTVDEIPNSVPTSCLGAQRLPIQISTPQTSQSRKLSKLRPASFSCRVIGKNVH